VGHLTQNAVTRAAYYEQVIIMALIPYMNPELYPEYCS
jgi:non-canonical (house-cleaning) NTP pyrophosphatase